MPHDPVSIHADSENSAALAGSVAAITDEAKKRLENAARMTEMLITNRPAIALGAALTAGVLLGCLIKRR